MKDTASDSYTQSGNIPHVQCRNMSVNLGKKSPPRSMLLACQSLAAVRAKNSAAWIFWGRWGVSMEGGDMGRGEGERGTF